MRKLFAKQKIKAIFAKTNNMKKLIFLALILTGCKKEQQQPTPQPQPQPVNQLKSVNVSLRGTGQQGKADVNWDYKGVYAPTQTLTLIGGQVALISKAVQSNSVQVTGFSTDCPTCPNKSIEYAIYVDGLLAASGYTDNLNVIVKVQ